ncbi:gastrula zinc finger protein XlCGF67.1-like [Wyeomyia smithii]|uniref:gastrula zinc finger protein XlCGF67.1-like n=1 Tax=Wyeomyia smithii TaxID=174621 RepID=UPI002467F303|nr:gastrula zinc finger protein XlCGF67.1-like [Wyeomyia smithii]
MTSNLPVQEICNEMSIDSIGGSEEIPPYQSELDSERSVPPVDSQEVLISDLFVGSMPDPSQLVGPNEANCSLVCDTCSKRFNEWRKLQRHLDCHRQQKLKCEHCGTFLKSRSTYASHLQRHKNIGRFQCDHCDKNFAARRDLQTHLKVHDATAERFSCDICGKDFGRIYSLLDHRKLHNGATDFCCEKCGKEFTKRRHLLLHERTHLLEEEGF